MVSSIHLWERFCFFQRGNVIISFQYVAYWIGKKLMCVIGIRVYCRDVWKQSLWACIELQILLCHKLSVALLNNWEAKLLTIAQTWHPLERERKRERKFRLFRSFHHNLHNHYLVATEKNMRPLRSVVLVQLFFFKRPTFNGWRNEVILFLVIWNYNILQNLCLPIGSGEA